MNQNIYDKLKQILSSAQVKADEPMKNHITFRVGGPADVYVVPKTKEELLQVITCCKAENVPYYIIGNGSNTSGRRQRLQRRCNPDFQRDE